MLLFKVWNITLEILRGSPAIFVLNAGCLALSSSSFSLALTANSRLPGSLRHDSDDDGEKLVYEKTNDPFRPCMTNTLEI